MKWKDWIKRRAGSARRRRMFESEAFVVRPAFGDELLDLPDPPTEEDQIECISAEDAARLLFEARPLVRKRVRGDLILGKRGLTNPFEFEIDGRKIVLAGFSAPQLERDRFGPAVRVEGCLFEGRFDMAGLWFESEVHVSSSAFLGDADFQYSVFDKGVVFSRCRFESKARFLDTTFWGGGHFERTSFLGRADFYNAVFHDGASFEHSGFQFLATFSQSRFAAKTSLWPCANFRDVVCHEPVYLEGAKFERVADFTGAQFKRQVEFDLAQFHFINLTNAEFGRIGIKWEQLEGQKLLFGDIAIKGVDVSKESIDSSEFERLFDKREDVPLPDKHRQYDILKAIFIRQGDHISADACFYEWKQVERRESRLTLNPESWMIKAFHYLNWLSCGYGVKPIRTLLFSLALIGLFAAAYLLLDPAVSASVRLDGGVFHENSGLLGEITKKLEISFLSFMNFEAAKEGLSRLLKLLTLIERLLGWVTLLLFVTTYTRLMLR